MTTFSLNPTYYQVTWTLNSPTDYSSLGGDDAGGLDSDSASRYNSLVHLTGNTSVSSTVMSDGETIVINGYTIRFNSSMTLANVISTINQATKFTDVIADQRTASNYITLANAPGKMGQPFYVSEGNGTALSKLGISAVSYGYYPNVIGSSFTNVNTGSNITINGVNIVFTAGGLSSVVSQLNAQTPNTGIVARPAASKLQLASVNGQPWVINSGNAVSNIGMVSNGYGGYPVSLVDSQSKERANMRWTQAIAELESFSTPMFVGNIVRTGNLNGNGACTTFTFTVGYEHPDQVVTVARDSEPDTGNVLVGTSAVKRAVARAMVNDITGNRNVFDPTLQLYGSYIDRPNSARIQKIIASAIDSPANIVTQVEANISVTQIAGV